MLAAHLRKCGHDAFASSMRTSMLDSAHLKKLMIDYDKESVYIYPIHERAGT